jgi:hypothetical protein
MNKILYTDFEGSYSILEYNQSHGQLLLRKRLNNDGHSNIDIIFKSIQYISIPTTLVGIEISIILDKLEINFLIEKFAFKVDYGYVIYSIKDLKGREFYLNGGLFGVFTNQLDILESSLGDFTWSESNKIIYWSGDSQ